MIFQPILPWWTLGPLCLLLIGVAAWRLWHATPSLWLRWARRIGMTVLVAIIAFRPSVYGGTAQAGTQALDVFFVVDTTSSVVAEDYNGKQPRLTGIKSDITAIAAHLAGARFALMTFDSDATLDLPLSSDGTAVASVADALGSEITLYSQGSSIDKPIELLQKQLEKAQKAHPERKRLVVYMGDGEQTTDKSPASFAGMQSLVDGGLVLGYGTASGGRMQKTVAFGSTKPEYIQDLRVRTFPAPDALSKINEGNLQAIASQLRLQYQHRTRPDDAKRLVATTAIAKAQAESRDVTDYNDLYWLFAIGLVALVLWETWNISDELIALRRAKGQKS